jgi:MYXO-CTERM domain-containing protein
MKTACIVLALTGFAGTAMANPELVSGPVQNVTLDALVDGYSNRAVVRVYDNWTVPPTALQGLFASGTNEIADDLAMTGGGLLTNMGLNIANVTGASNLTGGSVAIRFYDGGSGTFISGFNANLPALALPAGGSSRLQFGPNSLNALNIVVPANAFVSLQWVTFTFAGAGTAADLGFQIRNGGAIGTSTDGMINVTTNSPISFGGNPLANTALYIEVDDAIPAPAALALLGMGGLVATRRRRR